MTLYDELGIDDSAGIDKTEVEAIKRLLDRIKVEAAQVARNNDADTTIAILKEVARRIHNAAGAHSVDELQQQLGGNAQTSQQQPAALGAGSSTSTPPNGVKTVEMTDDEVEIWEKFKAASKGEWKAIGRMLDPNAANAIEVDDDGTPVMTTQALEALNNERDDTRPNSIAGKLKKLQDDTNPNSLAGQLKTSEEECADLRKEVTDLEKEVADLKKNPPKSILQTDLQKVIGQIAEAYKEGRPSKANKGIWVLPANAHTKMVEGINKAKKMATS